MTLCCVWFICPLCLITIPAMVYVFVIAILARIFHIKWAKRHLESIKHGVKKLISKHKKEGCDKCQSSGS